MVSTQPHDTAATIGIPYPFVSPSLEQFHSDQFYWDTYFTILGLVRQDRVELAQGMIENLVVLFQRFQLVPMRNRTYDTGISQPPLLTSMIKEVYAHNKDKKWLRHKAFLAAAELENYWMNIDDADHIANHRVHPILSRYADHHLIDQTAEHESGWDMTSRFNNHALSFLPVDLNSLLYRYEKDLAEIYSLLGDDAQSKAYLAAADVRAKYMHEIFWSETNGFFFDFDYIENKRHHFFSLAGYFPLWAGWATKKQAELIVKKLNMFEFPGGLANSQADDLIVPYKQWDYPNGWAPIIFIVTEGLRNYGYHEESDRITQKWLDLVSRIHQDTGKFWEKYDVVHETVGKEGRYPTQHGFAWTNGTFVALAERLAESEKLKKA